MINKWMVHLLYIMGEGGESKFSIEIWRYCLERDLLWHVLKTYFSTFKILSLVCIFYGDFCKWFCSFEMTANSWIVGKVQWGQSSDRSKVLYSSTSLSLSLGCPWPKPLCKTGSQYLKMIQNYFLKTKCGFWKAQKSCLYKFSSHQITSWLTYE